MIKRHVIRGAVIGALIGVVVCFIVTMMLSTFLTQNFLGDATKTETGYWYVRDPSLKEYWRDWITATAYWIRALPFAVGIGALCGMVVAQIRNAKK